MTRTVDASREASCELLECLYLVPTTLNCAQLTVNEASGAPRSSVQPPDGPKNGTGPVQAPAQARRAEKWPPGAAHNYLAVPSSLLLFLAPNVLRRLRLLVF